MRLESTCPERLGFTPQVNQKMQTKTNVSFLFKPVQQLMCVQFDSNQCLKLEIIVAGLGLVINKGTAVTAPLNKVRNICNQKIRCLFR